MVPPNYPDFPDRADLPAMTEDEARAALDLLRLLVAAGDADCYTAAGGPRKDGRYFWNVWIESHVIPGGKRIPLREWAASMLCIPHTPDDRYTLTDAGRRYLADHGGDGGEAA
jgi:hypothetical protein